MTHSDHSISDDATTAHIVQAALAHAGARSQSIFFSTLRPASRHVCVEFTMTINIFDSEYDYSKLYYCTSSDDDFSEDRVICFKFRYKDRPETVRLPIPDAARSSGHLRLRVDALPYSAGRVACSPAKLVEGSHADDPSDQAALVFMKEQVRAEVSRSEQDNRARVPHYPESLSLELTAGCNLTCSHCSSHGDPDEHRTNNRRASFDIEMLDRLADEVFPYLTLVNLVGRGEPMMVSDKLWTRLISHLDRYRVLMTCVTNGYFLRQRITERELPHVDTITVSIDGTTQNVFAENRGGGRLATVLDNVGHFNRLRHSLPLARRPRLGFSWTLKKNNIHQFPDFIRMIKPFDPTLLYVRHLFIFRDKDREQSLLGRPDLVNPYLQEAYALLDGGDIKLDVPPLMSAG